MSRRERVWRAPRSSNVLLKMHGNHSPRQHNHGRVSRSHFHTQPFARTPRAQCHRIAYMLARRRWEASWAPASTRSTCPLRASARLEQSSSRRFFRPSRWAPTTGYKPAPPPATRPCAWACSSTAPRNARTVSRCYIIICLRPTTIITVYQSVSLIASSSSPSFVISI